jgi:hypothetical protein
VRLLDGEELARRGVQVAAVGGVRLVAPGEGLGVQVVEVLELAASEEVVLDEVEGALDAGGAVGVPLLVGGEDEAVAVGKGGHLRHRDHVPAGAVQHHHVGVVDHAAVGGAAEVAERVGEEELAGEAGEAREALDEDHPAVTEDQARGLDAAELAGDLGVVGRGVVLHLLARAEVVLAGRLHRLLADAVAAAEGGERLVRERRAGVVELLVHADEVALAVGVEDGDVGAVGVAQLGPLEARHLGAAGPEHLAHRVPGDAECARDATGPVSLKAQPQDRRPRRLVEHSGPPSRRW